LDDVLTLAPSLTYRKRRASTIDQKTVKLPTSNLQTADPRRKKAVAIRGRSQNPIHPSLAIRSLIHPASLKKIDEQKIKKQENAELLKSNDFFRRGGSNDRADRLAYSNRSDPAGSTDRANRIRAAATNRPKTPIRSRNTTIARRTFEAIRADNSFGRTFDHESTSALPRRADVD
jgi:hypothetical protein